MTAPDDATSGSRRSITVAEIAERIGGSLIGDGETVIKGVAAVDEAHPNDVTFIADPAHAERWRDSCAGAVVVTRGLKLDDPKSRPRIDIDNAELASIALLELFQPPRALPDAGVHPTAFVHPSARIGRHVRIGAHVSIQTNAVIGDGVVLHPGVRVYAEVLIGDLCELHANCVVRERCRLGKRVILHQNVSIGADGFGYRPEGGGSSVLKKMPHIGAVDIGDDVEIGAGACVDRGKFRDTVIGVGTKIDNLVQIGHNCIIGRSCVIAGQVGLAGSVRVEDDVQIGAQTGITEGVAIGSGARIAGKSGVISDVPPGATVMGIPAQDRMETLRQLASLRKLPAIVQRLTKQPRHSDVD